MLSGEGKENGQNKSVGLIAKKNFARAADFFVHFCVVVLHDHNEKLGQKLPSYTFYGGNVVCFPVHFFSLPLIFTLVTASISHFRTAAIKFLLFFQQNLSPLFLTSRFSAFSVIHVNVDIKIKSKERIDFIVVILLSLKVRVAMQFTTETRRYLKYKISPEIRRRGGRTYGRFCGNQNRFNRSIGSS